ncbi:MAG: PP2C family protein-serine/threonine phosphatase, partial [Litorivicinus sp.]
MRIIRDKTSNHLQLLSDMSHAFATSTDLNRTLSDALADIAESIGVEAGSLFLLNEARDQLVCLAAYGPTDIKGMRVPTGKGVIGKAVETRQASITDARQSTDFTGHVDRRTQFQTRMLLTAPLLSGERCLGAVQLINPIPSSRVFDQSSLEALRVLSNAAALALRNAHLTQRLVGQAKMQAELDLAREVQNALLTLQAPEPEKMAGINLAARNVSGDFYSFLPVDEGVAFCIADVSGKGAHAGMLMARVATLWRLLAKQYRDPAQLLSILNDEICDTNYRGMFCTMVVGVRNGTNLQFAMAGHEPVLQRSIADGTVQSFVSTVPPLGIISFATPPPVLEIDLIRGPAY